MPSIICKSTEDVNAFKAFIASNDLLTYDIETDGLNVHTGKVIGFGVSNKQTSYYLPLLSYQTATDSLQSVQLGEEHCKGILLLLQSKNLIMHDGSFDIRFTKNALGVDLLPALYADTMLMKHTCDENHPMGLKEIATMLWGHDVKKEKEEMQRSIKANGGTATQYYKADTELVGRYCNQDCLLTFSLFDYYSNSLKEQGLVEFYYTAETMDLYKLATIPMEQRGVRVDVRLMRQMEREIEADITAVEEDIQSIIAPFLGIFTTWFLNKDYPLQTAKGNMPKWAKAGLTQQQAWEKDYPGAYMFNLNSKFHLKKLFFDTLKKTPLSKTPTGMPQVDDDFISAQPEEWCRLLTVYNKLNKLKSTYITGILEELHDGRFYPSYKQHGTTSGRYSSDMQQLPCPMEQGQEHELVVKYTNSIRSFILPDVGCSLISADYQQLEPSVFAHVSGDVALQAVFHEGKDLYSEVAIRTEKIDGASSDKKAPNYLGKINKVARQNAKAYVLGVPYGLTGYKLKFMLGCTDKEADKLVQDYLNAFPGLQAWMSKSKEQIMLTGNIRTQTGRVRHAPRAAQLYKKYGPAINDDLQLWKEFHESSNYPQAKLDRREYKNYLNNGCNFQIQGLGASIINRASIAIAKRFNELGMQTAQVGQIHDELLFNSPINEVPQAKVIIKTIMESIMHLTVPLRAEPIAGINFGQCK